MISSRPTLAERGTRDEKNYQEGGKHKPNGNEDEVTQRARPIGDSKAIFCPEVRVVVPCVVQNSAVFHISSPIPCVHLHARHTTSVLSRLQVRPRQRLEGEDGAASRTIGWGASLEAINSHAHFTGRML